MTFALVSHSWLRFQVGIDGSNAAVEQERNAGSGETLKKTRPTYTRYLILAHDSRLVTLPTPPTVVEPLGGAITALTHKSR